MKQNFPRDLSSLSLHLIAMAAMLCDHLWATLVPGNLWLTWVGRLAFPIFAFLIAEGYRHTRSFKKYLGRIFLFALLSELPFNLMYTGSWIFPFHQNVLWSFFLSLLAMKAMDGLKKKFLAWLSWPLAAVTAGFFLLLGQLLMVDYYSYGVMTALLFWLFPGRTWGQRLGQLAGMVYIHGSLMGSMTVPVSLFGLSFDLSQQSMAVLALLPIWAYRGRQGAKNKWISLAFYGFYPLHMLILGLLSR